MPPKRKGKSVKGKPGKPGKPGKTKPKTVAPTDGEQSQDLGPKESRILRELSTDVDCGAYKRAIKNADIILAKYPHNGETKAMKALALYRSGKKEEGVALVEEARSLNKKTHLTWHVSGIIYKGEKRWAEAMSMLSLAASVWAKAHDGKTHAGLLRDASALALLLRDYDKYHSLCHRLMESEQAVKQRGTWHSCALANHLLGHHDVALKLLEQDVLNNEQQRDREVSSVLNAAQKRVEDSKLDGDHARRELQRAEEEAASVRKVTVEQQEAPLAQCRILWECGRFDEAAAKLEEICRRGYVLQEEEADRVRAGLALRLGDVSTAQAAFSRLAMGNPEGLEAVAGLMLCRIGAIPRELRPLQSRPSAMPKLPATSDAAAGVWRQPRFGRSPQFEFVACPVGSSAAPVKEGPLSDEERAACLAIVDDLRASGSSAASSSSSSSHLLRTLPLFLLPASDARFAAVLERELRTAVRRGRGSALAFLEPLYAAEEDDIRADALRAAATAAAGGASSSSIGYDGGFAADGKVAVIERVLEQYATAATASAQDVEPAFGGAEVVGDESSASAAGGSSGSRKGSAPFYLPAPLDGDTEHDGEPASGASEHAAAAPFALLLWAEHLLRCGRPREALPPLDLALKHSPTLPDLLLAKARALAALGAWEEAADAADAARRLDLADRAASVVAVQCMCHCGRLEEAWEAVELFARPDGDIPAYFRSMMTFWMTLATARGMERAGQLGRAMVRYQWLVRSASGLDEASEVFYGYSLRICRMRSTMDLCRWGDESPVAEVFVEAQAGLVRCWLKLADDASLHTDELGVSVTVEDGRDRSALRKAAKKERAAHEKHVQAVSLKHKGNEDSLPDSDPTGAHMTSDSDPLARAEELVLTMVQAAERVAVAHARGIERSPVQHRSAALIASCGMDVALRRGKPVLALRALAASSPRLPPSQPGATAHPPKGLRADLLADPEVCPLAARFLRLAQDETVASSWPLAVRAVVERAVADPAWSAAANGSATTSTSSSSSSFSSSMDAMSFAEGVARRMAPLGLAERVFAARTLVEATGCQGSGQPAAGAAVPAAAVSLLQDLETGVVSAAAAEAAQRLRAAVGVEDAAADAAAAARFAEADAWRVDSKDNAAATASSSSSSSSSSSA